MAKKAVGAASETTNVASRKPSTRPGAKSDVAPRASTESSTSRSQGGADNDTQGGASAKAQEPTHAEIAQRALELYHARGGHDGGAESDWLRAESELRKR